MGFLTPWFLAGLAAVGLPIWLHLLRQHRSNPLPFSSLMFFEQRIESSIKHRRLRYLLLLALRVALLVMLALAFANPFMPGKPAPASGGQKMVVLALDCSFSMRQGDRLGSARREALRTLEKVPPGDQAQVLAFAAQVRVLAPPTREGGALRAAIQSLEPSDSRSSYGELARALRALASSARLPLQVHLFSDTQKSSLPPGFADLELPAGADLVLHPVVTSRAANWTVESVNAQRTRVQAVIAGFGTERARRSVSLVVNDRVLETKTLEVPAGGRATVEFHTLEAPHGFSRGEVRVDSGDSFPADDRFFFPVERADPRHVLFVHEARDTRALLYFRTALEASPEAAFTLEPVTVEQAANASPSTCAFVVLSNVASLPEAFEEALRKYVRGGGSVLIALGPASAVRKSVPVFDAAVVESRYSSREGERFQSATWLDPTHPSIRRANRWEGVRFYQAIRVEPANARVLARLADQTPLLLEKQIGEGRALLFASTFDNISNDFPLHTSFVPFVEQTANYLGGLEDRLSNVLVDSHLELRRSRASGEAVEVIDPQGRRALSLAESASAQSTLLSREGFYEVRRSNARRELVAVNTDRRESDLELIPKETLALWQNTGQGAATESTGAQQAAKPRTLWWQALWVVLVLALAESLVANRHLSVRKEEA
jgi:hypothetical protein